MFTDAKTQDYEARVTFYALETRPPSPATGPVRVQVVAVFPLPKGAPKWKRRLADSGCLYHTTIPDLDNVVKALLDGINPAGWWVDDKQVAHVQAVAVYGSQPGAHVRAGLLPTPEEQRE